MFVLGLLLMAATAGFVGLLIAYNLSAGPDYTVTLLSSQPFTVSTLGAFLSGLALALIFGFGMWLMLGGTMLARHRHRKQRTARRDADQATMERDTMATRLQETERRQSAPDSVRPEPAPAEPSPRESVGAGSSLSHRRHRARTRLRRPHLPHLTLH